jgi:hypothetical protein
MVASNEKWTQEEDCLSNIFILRKSFKSNGLNQVTIIL